jgi:hypothetical protein
MLYTILSDRFYHYSLNNGRTRQLPKVSSHLGNTSYC